MTGQGRAGFVVYVFTNITNISAGRSKRNYLTFNLIGLFVWWVGGYTTTRHLYNTMMISLAELFRTDTIVKTRHEGQIFNKKQTCILRPDENKAEQKTES